jgi:hypothetical protein
MPSETLQLFMQIESCAIVRMCTKHDHPSQLSSKWADGRMRGFSLSKSKLLTKRKRSSKRVSCVQKDCAGSLSFTTLASSKNQKRATIRNVNNCSISICTVASDSLNNSHPCPVLYTKSHLILKPVLLDPCVCYKLQLIQDTRDQRL